jgi:uncharacterized membrane protein
MKEFRIGFILAALTLGLTLAHGAVAPALKYRTILIPGAAATAVEAVNNLGNYVVSYVDAQFVQHCGYVVGKTVANIFDPSGVQTFCNGLNNNNEIAGNYTLANRNSNGFVYSVTTGTFTDIIVPGAINGTSAFGINDAGQVAGTFADAVGSHGFFYDGSTYQTLDVPFANAAATTGWGLNNAGEITLQYVDVPTSTTHSATLLNNTYTQLDVPGALQSYAQGINNHGQIAYQWEDGTKFQFHSAVYGAGKFVQVAVPGASRTCAFGINDSGLIVGAFIPNGKSADSGFSAHK